MTSEKLKETLDLHRKWVYNEEGGVGANPSHYMPRQSGRRRDMQSDEVQQDKIRKAQEKRDRKAKRWLNYSPKRMTINNIA